MLFSKRRVKRCIVKLTLVLDKTLVQARVNQMMR